MTILLESRLPNLTYRGKVRDTYDLGDGWGVVGHLGSFRLDNWHTTTDATKGNYTDWKLGVTKDLSGWVVGAGYEWMIAPNWSLRGEYLYYGFTGNNNNNGALVFPATGLAVTGTSGKLNTSVARIGLDYKFDWLR